LHIALLVKLQVIFLWDGVQTFRRPWPFPERIFALHDILRVMSLLSFQISDGHVIRNNIANFLSFLANDFDF
jgi:hypothetical protein